MNDTQLIFILGSGRCGTKALVKMLAGTPGLEAHHEYCRYAYQREAVMYYMGRLPYCDIAEILQNIHGAAAHYSQSGIFLDSSHKLVWVSNVLRDIFPQAKFIHLVRDGRKVVSSFFHKLQIHDDRATEIVREWMSKPDLQVPPPSERYWWPLAPAQFDRFNRIVWHWAESNAQLLRTLGGANRATFRLEDLIYDEGEVKRLMDFVGLPYDVSYWQSLQRPDHVYVPINYGLTDEQRVIFNKLAGEMMRYFSYDIEAKEYDVKY